MSVSKLNIGVFGAGHLGMIHLQQWAHVPEAAVIGFYDPNDENAARATEAHGVPRFTNAQSLLDACDAADIVTPTTTHFALAKAALAQGRHLFIEKPLAHTLDEAQEILRLAREAGVVGAVGHVERYNPAFLALRGHTVAPMFIESHRLAQFNPRGTDVSVLLDLMIHDIDIVLHLVNSPVSRISASGVAVLSDTPDIANARIEFANGCVANLTASRISLKRMRKMRLFQKDAYIAVDFLDKKTEIVRLKNHGEPEEITDLPIALANGEERIIAVSMPEVEDNNAIRTELQAFTRAALGGPREVVTLEAGYAAMDVAHRIMDEMARRSGMGLLV